MSLFESIQARLDNPAIPWKGIIAGISVAQFAFETYLTYRQYRVLKNKKLPSVLENEITNETFVKSAAYSRAKARFSVVSDAFGLLQKLLVIKLDMMPRLWNFGVRLSQLVLPVKFAAVSSVAQSLWFLSVASNLSTLLDMPFSYYQHFVLEEKFGFNKLTRKLWVIDTLKGLVLCHVLGGPLLYGFLKIFEKFDTNFLWYICGFIFVVQILAITLVPVFIMPLFNKFTPLEDGDLKKSIEDLASSLGFPLDKIFVVDGSKRSSHSNAYFTGLPFTSKRIVLYDTLVQESSVEEITAVLAHEIGHWQRNHILNMIMLSQVHTFALFSLFSAVYRNLSLYNSFGFFLGVPDAALLAESTQVFTPDLPIMIGFQLFNDLLAPIECVMQFLLSLISRLHEYQADAYAKALGYTQHLAQALINLQIKNLSTMNVDPWYSAYHYSHPTLAERLNALGYVSRKKAE
ncbi:STE24 (YJR117W) [Zygosaccharomyces parabailii]|nr:STE24 (YJR117W) [Zygosaccharomyces parabailii]CDH09260.1 probable CAAX prenyl protease 1 [Zygosaccharomyces bailii ISA1307]